MLQFRFFTLLLMIFLFHLEIRADASKNSWSQRSQNRENKRWTLQEWLSQKERMSLMDQWLSMNAPSPFEFYIKGAHNSYKSESNSQIEKSSESASGSFGAYAQAVGLTGEYENNWEENFHDITGLLNFRILGNSLQTTSLTFHIGQRTRHIYFQNEKEVLQNYVGQATLQTYVTRYFGFQGVYRHIFKATNTRVGEIDGNSTEGGIFLDFAGLRVFGSWYQDLQKESLAGAETKTTRTGYKTGLQIFF